MFIQEYLSTLILLCVYLGYTWIWGGLIRNSNKQDIWFVIIYGVLLILPMSMTIPWSRVARINLWVLAVVLIWIHLRRPIKFPAWLWDSQFCLAYFGFMMMLVLAWAGLSKEPVLWIWIGIPSLMANLLVIRRIWMEKEKDCRTVI